MGTALIVVVFAFLIPFGVKCGEKPPKVISNCYVRYFNNIRCTGDFNVSHILFEQRQLRDRNDDTYWHRTFRSLEIFDSNIEEIGDQFFEFHGFKFETILIENAPKLTTISPKALIELKDDLTDFRAINTGLPQYNDFGNDPHKMQNPFDGFTELHEVYIGRQSHCPSDENLLFPCTCEFGELPRTIPSKLYGWSSGTSNTFGNTTQVTCNTDGLAGEQLKQLFVNLSRSDHEPKHFDVLTIQGVMSLTDIPMDVFSNVSITAIWMNDVSNLKSIHPKAFASATSDHTARSIQVLDINTANFTAATTSEVEALFQAFSSLTNIRVLRLSECGIPYIPSHAFVPEDHQKLLNNLRYLSLSFDRRRYKSGIKSVGSYAFSGAPKLVELGISKNFIEKFDSFAFAFNETSTKPLTTHIGGNPFNDTYGLKENAFSGSQRPVHIKFEIDSFAASDPANAPSIDFMPENVFRPFIEENPENYFEVDYFNLDVWCDCKSRWMFDDIGRLKRSVQNGLRIKRVMNNVIESDPQSVQCKVNSSFECLPNCLSFRSAGLIHCGGNKEFDVRATFLRLSESSGTEGFSRLLFSSKEIEELPMDSFGSFEFDIVDLTGCRNLSSIHPNAFGASTATIKQFSAKNTNLTYYPNFASFPNLQTIQLDDYHTFRLNSSNFDFSASTVHPDEINVFVGNDGIIEPNTFTALNNATAVNLHIGERENCETIGCLLKCKPITYLLDKQTVTNFLDANPKNKIQTNCYFECSCDLKWMYESWNDVESRVGVWIQEYFGSRFYCVPKGVSLETEDNFFGIDVTNFDFGDYFKQNC
ncbi:uncharacterized protein LOC119077279 [Bradysia coprophila]|uniref:uncharacterized protein LOC119077279 n=1 Tax=Bradysia coprophila TaxID=38358 RepID=UPI00187DD470|nr:uncharacterized protein LOC119077279 [Bradysia coprophila]